MRKNLINSILAILLTIVGIGCGTNHEGVFSEQVNFEPGSQQTSKYDRKKGNSSIRKNQLDGETKDKSLIAPRRKLIRTGNLKFETTNIQKAESNLKSFTNLFNGFVSFEQQTRTDWMIRNDLEIRIPSHLFEAFLDSVLNNNNQIDEKNIKVVDVTNQYIDTESRLQTKKIVIAKYTEHLKKANKIEDILEVERQIGYIREEIESAEKQLRNMNDQISYSTLKIEFYQTLSRDIPEQKNAFVKGFINGWEGLQWFLLLLVTFWPCLIVAAALVIYFKK